jgi:hypothetical protein
LTVATNRTPPPQARHASEKRFVYSEDGSWLAEVTDFFTSIETGGRPVINGTTAGRLELMRIIERIYEDGNCLGNTIEA